MIEEVPCVRQARLALGEDQRRRLQQARDVASTSIIFEVLTYSNAE
jgi:hypothetical protein